MTNGIVIYKSRYGATHQYAEWIGDECRLPLLDPERLDNRILSVCDFLIIGTPVYTGQMLIKDWLKHNAKTLLGKKIFLFVVCSNYADPAIQQDMIIDNIPVILQEAANIFFLPGRLTMKDLSTADREILTATSHDIDAVEKKNLDRLLRAIRSFAAGPAVKFS